MFTRGYLAAGPWTSRPPLQGLPHAQRLVRSVHRSRCAAARGSCPEKNGNGRDQRNQRKTVGPAKYIENIGKLSNDGKYISLWISITKISPARIGQACLFAKKGEYKQHSDTITGTDLSWDREPTHNPYQNRDILVNNFWDPLKNGIMTYQNTE